MRAAGWVVTAYCPECKLVIAADPRLVERLGGADFSLWNRQAPCRWLGCPGRVEFQGKPPEIIIPFAPRAEWLTLRLGAASV